MNDLSIKRFWNKVIRGSECWGWSGWQNTKGYGMFWLDGKDIPAPRVSFYIHNGFYPEICCHTCDNPECVNPDHLFNGSPADNLNDCVDKGRHKFASRIACGRGHIYTTASALIVIASNGKHHRYCRTCKNLRQRKTAVQIL